HSHRGSVEDVLPVMQVEHRVAERRVPVVSGRQIHLDVTGRHVPGGERLVDPDVAGTRADHRLGRRVETTLEGLPLAREPELTVAAFLPARVRRPFALYLELVGHRLAAERRAGEGDR